MLKAKLSSRQEVTQFRYSSCIQGRRFAVIPGRLALVTGACGSSLAGWPRQGCALAGEPSPQFGPETPTVGLAKLPQRFVLLQNYYADFAPLPWYPGTSKQKKTTQAMCWYSTGLHKSIASEIKESFTSKEKKEKSIPLPFLEGIYIISHSSIKLNFSFPPRVHLVIPLLCHRHTSELLGNQTYVLSLL